MNKEQMQSFCAFFLFYGVLVVLAFFSFGCRKSQPLQIVTPCKQVNVFESRDSTRVVQSGQWMED